MGKFILSRYRGRVVVVLLLAIVVLVFFGGHATARTITVDGNPSDWAGISPTITGPPASRFRSLSVTNDAGFVYFLGEFASDIFIGCGPSGGDCPSITMSLDPDLNGTFFCEPGIAIGINLDPFQGGNPGVGRLKPGGGGSCGFSFDFPGAVTVVGSGRFIEASVSLSALKQIAPSLTSFDIFVWSTNADIPKNPIGRYVLESGNGRPTLALSLNQTTFSPGDPLRVGLKVDNPGQAFNADFYFGYLLPDGVTAFFVTSLAPLNGVTARIDGNPQAFKPLAANVLIPQGMNVTLNDVFVFTFSGNAPLGTYVFFEALTLPNAFAYGQVQAGDILAMDSKAFTVTSAQAPFLYFPWDQSENPWVLTQGPHDWEDGSQSGLDFDKDSTPRRVLSMFDGVVTFVGLDERFYCKVTGQYTQNPTVKVRATDGSGWELWYLHLSRIDVLEGTPVHTGDLLGLSGKVGCSTNVHLHVELLIAGKHTSWWGKSIIGQDTSGRWLTWQVSSDWQSLNSIISTNPPIFALQNWTTDENNNPKTSFAPGETIQYATEVRNVRNTAATAIFTFRAGSIFRWQGSVTVPPGGCCSGLARFYSPSTIPTSASPGTYYFDVLITYTGEDIDNRTVTYGFGTVPFTVR